MKLWSALPIPCLFVVGLSDPTDVLLQEYWEGASPSYFAVSPLGTPRELTLTLEKLKGFADDCSAKLESLSTNVRLSLSGNSPSVTKVAFESPQCRDGDCFVHVKEGEKSLGYMHAPLRPTARSRGASTCARVNVGAQNCALGTLLLEAPLAEWRGRRLKFEVDDLPATYFFSNELRRDALPTRVPAVVNSMSYKVRVMEDGFTVDTRYPTGEASDGDIDIFLEPESTASKAGLLRSSVCTQWRDDACVQQTKREFMLPGSP